MGEQRGDRGFLNRFILDSEAARAKVSQAVTITVNRKGVRISYRDNTTLIAFNADQAVKISPEITLRVESDVTLCQSLDAKAQQEIEASFSRLLNNGALDA